MRRLSIGLLFAVILSLTLSLTLSACGTKGPLYHLPQQEPSQPLFVRAGEKMGLTPTAADLGVCRPVCQEACAPELPKGSKVTLTPKEAARVATCQARCVETCPAGASAKRLFLTQKSDGKGLSWPALNVSGEGAAAPAPAPALTPSNNLPVTPK
jgi:predicted small lipoprotein YifL